MNTDFPRILTLLRKEKGISQKSAAEKLEISQALLSHYEKGIRECGLDFLVRCADFYGVSCDYLLGRSPEPTGSRLTVEDIPDPDAAGKENRTKGSGTIMPLLQKKLIANSLNILFDLIQKLNNHVLLSEVSSYLMLAVYRMFRIAYSANPKNQEQMFTVPQHLANGYTTAAMMLCETNAAAAAGGQDIGLEQKSSPENSNTISVTTELLTAQYPLFASSLLNLIKNAEKQIADRMKD